MEKILYLQIDADTINSTEVRFLDEFLGKCELDGFHIMPVKVKANGQFDMDDHADKEHKKRVHEVAMSLTEKEREQLRDYVKTETDARGLSGLFCVAICQNQELIDYFRTEGIPVIGYEGGLTHQLVNNWILLSFESVDFSYLWKVHHRFHGIPLYIMETERTIIRELCMDDMDDLFKLYEGEHMTDYMEPLYEREEEESYEANYIEKVYGFYDYGMWLVFHKETKELIGRAGVESRGGIEHSSRREDDDYRNDPETVELGYAIKEEYQNKGYATEVCSAIIRYTFDTLGMKRIYAQVDEKNIPSVKLLKKLNFVQIDTELYEILN
ncbi:MAG: GNAT family N-acetyltransferase [Lachnospiraceae bacterium]|nr:GNAT family N-acetyltransferase [Lachnospiraceae bacterium]